MLWDTKKDGGFCCIFLDEKPLYMEESCDIITITDKFYEEPL